MSTASAANANSGGRAHARQRLQQLRKPLRGLVAVVELLLAAGAVAGAFALWHTGVVQIVYPLDSGPTLVSTRLLGDHIGGAIGLCTLAGLLLLDALRQAVLALRARRRRKEPKELAAWQQLEAAERAGDNR